MIAYCFLTYNDLERIDIWERYFEKKNDFKVYIHSKEPIQPYKYSFPVNIIKDPIKTINKSHISIVEATLHLLKRAFEDDENITHFVFLTQSCIPLYEYNKMSNLINKFKKSVISIKIGNRQDRYNSLHFILRHKIKYNQFVKQQPNMILTREDVEWLIKNDYTEYFKNMECPDEHYFVNIFLYIYNKEFIRQQINFCNPDLQKTQAITHYKIDKHFIMRNRNIGFLFCRKIHKYTWIDLEYLFSL